MCLLSVDAKNPALPFINFHVYLPSPPPPLQCSYPDMQTEKLTICAWYVYVAIMSILDISSWYKNIIVRVTIVVIERVMEGYHIASASLSLADAFQCDDSKTVRKPSISLFVLASL